MLIKRFSLLFLATMLMMPSAFANKGDWTGTFSVSDDYKNSNLVTHTPSHVSLLFFSAGQCIHLSKGASLNGTVMKENVDLCVDSNVTTFKSEVAKLGAILNQSIQLGSTYSDN